MTTPAHTKQTQGNARGKLTSTGRTKRRDSRSDGIAVKIRERGQQYLHDAVTKIRTSTKRVAAWAKNNPVKSTLAVASLVAASTLLAKTMAVQRASKRHVQRSDR